MQEAVPDQMGWFAIHQTILIPQCSSGTGWAWGSDLMGWQEVIT